MTYLEPIQRAGFRLRLADGKLLVEPFSELTANQIEFLKRHKAEIIAELLAVNDESAKEQKNPSPTTISEAIALVRKGYTTKLFSKVLNTDIWIAADDAMAGRIAMADWYDGKPIYTEAEVLACKGMSPEGMRELHAMKVAFDGRIESTTQPESK